MVFLPPNQYFKSYHRVNDLYFGFTAAPRRASLQRSFNTPRSVSGGLGLAKWSKVGGQVMWIFCFWQNWLFFGTCDCLELIHNLACKVSTKRWPVTISCLIVNKTCLFWLQGTLGISQQKPNLAWASPTPGWQASTREICYGWIASKLGSSGVKDGKTWNSCYLPSHPESWFYWVMLIQKSGDDLGCIKPVVYLVG